MPATKLAVAVWFASAAAVVTVATAGVYALAASSVAGSGTATAANQPSPSPTATPNGNSQGNNGNGVGNGGSTGTQSSDHPITLTGTVVGAPAPGKDATLSVLVDNKKNQAINIRTVTATVTAVTSAGITSQDACNKTWYVISSFAGTQKVLAGATGVVPLTISFVNKPFKQDNCKGARYSFSYTATADQA